MSPSPRDSIASIKELTEIGVGERCHFPWNTVLRITEEKGGQVADRAPERKSKKAASKEWELKN